MLPIDFRYHEKIRLFRFHAKGIHFMVVVNRRRVEISAETREQYIKIDRESPIDINSESLFANERPLEIEIGFGKGLFLVNSAVSKPDVNFIGIELSRQCAHLTCQRLQHAGVNNVILFLTDARAFITNRVKTASVHAIHTYFPDPWWKRRHEKRRLYAPTFVQQVQRVLQVKGELHFWTDVKDYFDRAVHCVQTNSSLTRGPDIPCTQPEHDMDYLTHFHRKMSQNNRAIYRAYFKNS